MAPFLPRVVVGVVISGPRINQHDVGVWPVSYTHLTLPTTAAEVSVIAASGLNDRLLPATQDGTGHTEWANGHCHHSGFTVTLTPNTDVVLVDTGTTYHHTDYNSRQEGSHLTSPSYAVLTSRSYHTGIVNSCLADGSVRSISSNIDRQTWLSLGTRSNGEVVGEF